MYISVEDFALARGLQEPNNVELSFSALFQKLENLEISLQGELISSVSYIDELIKESNTLIFALSTLIKDVSAVFIYAEENETNDSHISRLWAIFAISETIRDLYLINRLCEQLKAGEKWFVDVKNLSVTSLLNLLIGLPYIKLAEKGMMNCEILEKLNVSANSIVDDAEMHLSDFTDAFYEAHETGEIEGNVLGSLLFMRLWSSITLDIPPISWRANNLVYYFKNAA